MRYIISHRIASHHITRRNATWVWHRMASHGQERRHEHSTREGACNTHCAVMVAEREHATMQECGCVRMPPSCVVPFRAWHAYYAQWLVRVSRCGAARVYVYACACVTCMCDYAVKNRTQRSEGSVSRTDCTDIHIATTTTATHMHQAGHHQSRTFSRTHHYQHETDASG